MSPKDAELRQRFGSDYAVTEFCYGQEIEAICPHCGEGMALKDELLAYTDTVARCWHCRRVIVFDEAALIGHKQVQEVLG